jgi:2,5-dichlorohydroquinone reductive dechlorinase
MRSAYERAENACENLEQLLTRRTTRWLFDDQITIADLFWFVELLRMKNLGASTFWENNTRPAVAEFVASAEALHEIRSAILDWPGALY